MFGRLRALKTEAYFVDLVGVRDADLVPAEIATELGAVEDGGLRCRGRCFIACLRDSSAIIVVDNLEELRSSRLCR